MALPAVDLPVSSFVNELAKEKPEILSIQCTSPVESAADKLSALSWRIPDRVRGSDGDDPSIVRHIHDLALLLEHVSRYQEFAKLVEYSMQQDGNRAKNHTSLNGMAMPDKLGKMLDTLKADKMYHDEYRRFVEDVSYDTSGRTPSFEKAVASLEELVSSIIK